MTITPSVIVFDVNETLSDMGPLAEAFSQAGMPESLTRPWFAELLRDGFALTAAGDNPDFADLAKDTLHRLLTQTSGPGNYQRHVGDIMGAFTNLALHADVAPGITALSRVADLVTLSNGATSVAESLLTRGGVQNEFKGFLSVQDALRWKPAREAYDYAATATGHPVDELLLVAVHPWDIHGAHAAGLRTAWINRTGATYPSYFTAPDIEAEDLVALAGILTAP
ncbi:2-haloacid dehalogenase [Arthrobacter sp. CAN_A2]|uniref:haloacid dehalogenase type II n=1 Tax=Arthrobacter sp. CAN_A2 TaxID=2787718 RepID=UPI0018EF6EA6